MKTTKPKREYSKSLLIQESVLIWLLTIGLLGLAFLCIIKGYIGTLPWLAAMVAFPWSAYGVSQAFYYKKSTKENTKNGIKYESIMAEVNNTYNKNTIQTPVDWSIQYTTPSPMAQTPPQTVDLDYGI